MISATAALTRANDRMRAEVRAGLSAVPRELPPKYFYDARGSLLFEEITRLPEYYLTRTERALLEAWMPSLIAELRPGSLVELGAGNASKSRIILDAMRAAGAAGLYVPIDVSGSFLEETAARLRLEYPGLRVITVAADITTDFDFPSDLSRPALHAFLGSTIGNFAPAAAVRLLGGIRAALRPSDRLLLGADLKKDVERIEAAYNDTRGITAEFNRNMLHVLNRELGADFDAPAFEHRAFYNPDHHWIEMHLVSARRQTVTIPGVGIFEFRSGESIRTEISCKYDRERMAELFAAAGLEIEHWRTDPDGLFALAVGARRQ